MRSLSRTPLILSLFLASCSGDTGTSLVITGSSTVAPLIADVAKRFEETHPGVKIDVQAGGSSRGIADAISRLADFGMISRDLKADEAGLTAHRLAIDGVGVIVHRDNPLNDLSRQQLVDLYTGKIAKWSQFGGADEEILVASKAGGRATLEVFLAYTGLDSADIVADVVVGENQQAIKTVAGDPNAVAYVSIGAATSEAEAGTPIKLVSCEGIAATTATVADGTFPITRPLQLVSKGDLSPLAREFLDYASSPANHDLIESQLYVPVAK